MTEPDPLRYADGKPDRATRRALAPPTPSDADWKRVSDGIALRVLPKGRGSARWVPLLAGAAAILLCMAGGIYLFGRGSPQTPPRSGPFEVVKVQPVVDDPLAEFAVLPVATDDEVRIALIRGDWDGSLVAGVHPLPGDLRIATADEVFIERVPDVMDAVPDFGGAPMVFGVRGKRSIE
jgi:hypothetical protein